MNQHELSDDGAQLDLRLRVYPDGHGDIAVMPSGVSGRSVNDLNEAAEVFQELWVRAATHRNGNATGVSRLAEMLQRVTPENVHSEVDDGGPVGHEVW